MIRRLFWFYCPLLALCLATCAPVAVRPSDPTPEWIEVYASPVWQAHAALLSECLPAGSSLAYVTALEKINPGGVILAWGSQTGPEGWQAFQLGAEELVVIAHPRNPALSISAQGLLLAYSGEIRDWDLLGQAPAPLGVWSYPAADEISGLLGSAGILTSRYVQIAPGPRELRAAVAADPAAIGLLPRAWLDASVRPLSVEGLDPAPLRAPLLAFTAAEPQGSRRQWLGCLQERLNAANPAG